MLGEYTGRIKITDMYSSYNVLMLIRSSQGSISSNEDGGKLNFEINEPKDWTYAKISVINSKTGKTDSTSARPDKKADITVFENGEYWIEAKIEFDGKTYEAFEKVQVNSATPKNNQLLDDFEIPERQFTIIAAIVIIIAIVGFSFRRI